ncbi:type II secretion system protein GspK [Xylophilus ampelinus]|uniref:General secretion pathway protein K n=2 Tax=Xylophilus ampelinus TaxID=54067 RepID=A0A318SWR0_9BURK|nr:type II secretion system protein GspK [Xylophilus ampelinus]PYE76033.1 general secretion pathway protein K [Xylophilus ampelinus]
MARATVSTGRGKPVAGMALVAVLWITAALSLMLTGMTASVRQEVRAASGARQLVEGRAVAEAAINLALQQMAAQPNGVTQKASVLLSFRGVDIQVQILPFNGLIDVNSAAPDLLQALFSVAGGMAPQVAEAAAQTVVRWRLQRDAGGRPLGLEAPEDLMLVPGFPYEVYARIAPLIAAGQSSGGKVNPLSAPDGVLVVLAKGNVAVAARIAAARDAKQVGIDLTQLEASFVGASTSRAYRLIASVPLPDGASMRFSQDVNFQMTPQSEIPWRILQSDSAVAVLRN